MFSAILMTAWCVYTAQSAAAETMPVPDLGGSAAMVAQAQPEEQPAFGGRRGGATTPAQPSRAAGEPAYDAMEYRVVRVQHAHIDALVPIVENTCGVTAIADNRTNSLILSGVPGSLKRAQDLIAQLDVAVEPTPETEMSMVPLQVRDANEVATALIQTYRNELRVVADRGRSLLMLKGPQTAIASAKEMIKSLDATPAAKPSVRIEAAFFRAQFDKEPPANAVPDDLKDVARELARFGKVGVFGRLSTMAAESESFEVEGDLSGDVKAKVSIGGVVVSAANEAVRLKFRARAQVEFRPPPVTLKNPDGSETTQPHPTEWVPFKLETTVSLRPGEYLVLGSAPHGWKVGESAILVLKVSY